MSNAEQRYAEAVDRYRLRYGVDGGLVLDKKIREHEEILNCSVYALARTNARRWLKAHGAEVSA